MNRQQIEMFISVAKHLNFTKAAPEFFTSQPTVSRQISLLEEEWGFPLFVRNKKEVRLTSGGAIMLSKCKEVISLIDSGLQENRELEQGRSGNIRIGCLESMDTSIFVSPTAVYFNKQNPNIHIGIEKRSFAELREKLDSGYFDIIFTFDFEAKYMQNIIYDKFCNVRCGFLMSKNHKLANRADLKLEDFSNETFILPDALDSPGRTEELKNILDRLGISCNNIIYVPNQDSIMLNIRAGKGLALMDSSITSIFEEEHFSFYQLPEGAAPLSVVYAWKQDNLNPVVALYINTLFLKEYIDVFYN